MTVIDFIEKHYVSLWILAVFTMMLIAAAVSKAND